MSFKLAVYQIIFWIFIFGKFYFYFSSANDTWKSIELTLIVVLFNMSIFYNHLIFIIPRFFKKWTAFFLLHLASLSLLIGIYYITNIASRIYGEFSLQAALAITNNYISFSIYSFLYWYVIKFLKEKELTLKLKNEKLVAEMKALKSQVSPHFLFNSLNNIYSLCLNNPDDAAMMTDKLSKQLRYLIYKGSQDLVLLSEEIHLIEDYIAIQQIKKHKGKVTFNVSLSNPLKKASIPPLLLITLVENAFTHGDVITNSNGSIDIKIENKETDIIFSIINSFDEKYAIKKSEGGIGLSNLRDQLQIKYPNHHNLSVETNNNLYTATLTICPISN